ncbi:glycoside hydrolase family 2 TIM barrel-domain containing protein [Sediminitomix flava]|uniref:Uncharacterized protein DUF4982 n=1 Tax=Sediminitomix flava TaxID=379075 RepID=A0A315Z569_SEDFL|nr:glycoside hydrolase family 2 TIM barrel-domain containing protein [Sediminitomix flava]PWJ37965.1 uncharacterized protein DUF4982 [Sediminitomix flava]
MKKLIYLVILTLAVSCHANKPIESRVTDFNFGWKFDLTQQNDDTNKRTKVDFIDEAWEDVQLPHDWVIKGSYELKNEDTAPATGYIYGGGIGWYRKNFSLSLEENQIAYVLFDGVYNNSEVFLNGKKLGEHAYGYSPFYYELNAELNQNGAENVLSVKVDHSRYADSRWYTGAGIYRNVELIVTDKLHIPVWGTFVNTPKVSAEEAEVNLNTEIANKYTQTQSFKLETHIINPQGIEVAQTTTDTSVEANSKTEINQKITVKKPSLWSIEKPYLYTAKTLIYKEDKVVDEYETTFGIRSIKFDANTGFYLNGENMKIKGVCLHHDAGLVGTAVPKEVWRRRLALLKEGGCNAIRVSHNPASEEFLDLCDEMGFLVQDEFFDEWDYPKDKRWNQKQKKQEYVTDGYAYIFQENAEKDLKNTILAHRNHPSIFQWSIGNEIEWTYPYMSAATGFFNNMNWSGNYFWSPPPYSKEKIRNQLETLPKEKYTIGETAKKLVKWTKELDTTRPVIANCILPSASHETAYGESIDIVGYSYRRVLYDYGHKNYPNKVIMGTENLAQYHEWKAIMERPFIAGTFLWTGIHYMGEIRGAWPKKGTGSGMIDFAGFAGPSYHMMKTLWNEEPHAHFATQKIEKSINKIDPETGLLVAKKPDAWKKALWEWHDVNEHWNYQEQEMISVEVYSNCNELELFLNDKSLGLRKLSEFEDHIYKWAVPFTKGELKVVGKKGEEAYTTSIHSANSAKSIQLAIDKTALNADGYDVAHVVAQIVDENGHPVKHEEQIIHFNVPEGLRLLGVDNGAIDNVQDHYAKSIETSNGRALLIVQATRGEGKVQVGVTAEGLKGDEVVLEVNTDNSQAQVLESRIN